MPETIRGRTHLVEPAAIEPSRGRVARCVGLVMRIIRKCHPFPFFEHRTLAQVDRTDALLAKAGREKFTQAESGELGELLRKQYRYNPPPDSDGNTVA